VNLQQTPKHGIQNSPDELWSGVRSNDSVLQRAHIFGCPVYVLDAALQDRKKIPKWNPQARLGLFLGFSDLHSSQVPLVLDIESGHISPQLHAIFDDKFETIDSLPSNQPLDQQWAKMFSLELSALPIWTTTRMINQCSHHYQK
jgi:hypothetical protein